MTLEREEAVLLDAGGTPLVGVMHIPEHATGAGLLIVPGAPQYRVGPHRLFVSLARQAAMHGITVLRIDRRGFGDSPDAPVPFDAAGPEIDAGLAALRDHDPRVRSSVILGLCDGASAAVLHGTTDHRVAGMVLLNPWVATEAGRARALLKGYYLPLLCRWRRWLAVLSSVARLKNALASIVQALIDSLRPRDREQTVPDFMITMLQNWTAFKGKTLVVLSGQDIDATAFDQFIAHTLGWGPLTEISATSVTRLRQADHTFTDRENRELMVSTVVDWLTGLAAPPGAGH